jgi:hypothetical protein
MPDLLPGGSVKFRFVFQTPRLFKIPKRPQQGGISFWTNQHICLCLGAQSQSERVNLYYFILPI